jgi:hypothetical protein
MVFKVYFKNMYTFLDSSIGLKRKDRARGGAAFYARKWAVRAGH